MTIKYYDDIEQGSDEWYAIRCGRQTASEMKLIIPPTLKSRDNPASRAYLNELLAQRITGYVEPSYISDDMLRGQEDEISSRLAYSQHLAPVKQTGFITNDEWGFIIGCSPDGLVGDDGGIECKSRCQKHQISTIMAGTVPAEHIIQVQTCMLVTKRPWWDYVSNCAGTRPEDQCFFIADAAPIGLPMEVIRVDADPHIHEAIIAAATAFERTLQESLTAYNETIKSNRRRFIPTVRPIELEIFA